MSKNITVNGTTYDASYVSAPLADGSGNAKFRESSELSLQSKSVTPTESQQTVTPASDYFALDKVIVGAIPSEYVKPTSTNAGGELAAGSTIAAGTYFTGAATVPSGGSGESNPIVKCPDAVKITKATTYDGTEIPANSLVIELTKGTDYTYALFPKSGVTVSGHVMYKIIFFKYNKTGPLAAMMYYNNQQSVVGVQFTYTTNKKYAYVTNSGSSFEAVSEYTVYTVPFSAIGWS